MDFRVGDRVRFTIESEVRDVGAVTIGLVGDGRWAPYLLRAEIVSAEKIAPPLPTTPGSVIKIETGHFAILQPDGLWCDETPEQTAKHWYEVIFDAGAK